MEFILEYRNCKISFLEKETGFSTWDFTKQDEPEILFSSLLDCLLWVKNRMDDLIDNNGKKFFD